MAVHPPWCGEPPIAELGDPPGDVTSYKVDGTVFEVPSHLQFLKYIGKGTYGAVSAFHDTNLGKDVAIKKIPNPFRNIIDSKRCLREVKLLRALEHECIIPLIDILPPPSPDFHEVYLVTELMDADLHTVISSDQPLTEDYVQFFIYQILQALLYMHSANVVHRDLKPLNVLVNKNCDIKLCDFGLARGRAGFSQEDDDYLRTEYIGTRWYRAPEVVLTSMEYTAAIDIWSAGCILGELIGRVPMFKGTDFLDQIRSVCEVLGTPTEEDMSFIPPSNQGARKFITTLCPGLPRKEWTALFPQVGELQCDLLDKMLRYDHRNRLTAQDALRHAYLADLYSEEDEVLAQHHVDWTFDDIYTETAKLQSLIYSEAASLHPFIVDRDREELQARGWPAAPGAAAPKAE